LVSAGYGYIDLAAPHIVYTIPNRYTSLGEVWGEIYGMGNVGIVRLSDGKLIYRRGL
jgi:hypothetical protein